MIYIILPRHAQDKHREGKHVKRERDDAFSYGKVLVLPELMVTRTDALAPGTGRALRSTHDGTRSGWRLDGKHYHQKRSFKAIYIQERSFHQDRLGTNIGKTHKKEWNLFAGAEEETTLGLFCAI